MRLVTYNLRLGGSTDPAVWARVMAELEPDVLFVQESREPSGGWLAGLPGGREDRWLWTAVPGRRWGSGVWVRNGHVGLLPVWEEFAGWVVAAVVEGCAWPGIGVGPVVALSVHGMTRKGSSYVKEVGGILDYVGEIAEGLPLVLAGDFNVAVGLREPGQAPSISRGERALIERLRGEFGLVPCWQTAHPGEPLARTLRWMHRMDSPPYHCDGLFVPASWAAALRGCAVLEAEQWCALSDHNPVTADFEVGVL